MTRRFFVLMAGLNALLPLAPALSASPDITVAFSPHQGATEQIVHFVDQARTSIQVAGYSFTSVPIATALVHAQERGVTVAVVLDKSNETGHYSSATYLQDHTIPLKIDHRYKIMHSKYIVRDGTSIETGSFNYTKAAEESNAENVLIIENDTDVAKAYMQNWQLLWQESEPYHREARPHSRNSGEEH